MKLKQWALVAEVVSAVAVVVSLIYVGYQIDQNTKEIRASNRQELVNRAVDTTRALATNLEVAGIIAKARKGESLSSRELTQYGYVIRSMLYDVQEAFFLHREGRLDLAYWKTRGALIRVYLRPEAALAIYDSERGQGILHEEFIAWADSQLGRD
jgi:hypothetical protein